MLLIYDGSYGIKYNLFSENQFGFISVQSIVLRLLSVIDRWTEKLDNGKYADVAYFDYLKTFWQNFTEDCCINGKYIILNR